ncbi:MAG: 50S ribosomal protein L4 [Candidatus Woesearchaeota archaeon]
MKIKILSIDGTEKGNVDLPVQFNEPVRLDLIRKVVKAIEANNRQPYGAKDDAGMRASAKLSRRRHDYRGAYGHGISRVPRKIMSHRGTRFNWVAAVVPGVVGGRRAHPPKSEKIYDQKINIKENQKAIRSALSATMNKEIVSARGHKLPSNYPFIVEDTINDITKTKQLKEILTKLGFSDEMNRTSGRKIRAGRGKSRGRRYKTKRGLLLVTEQNSKLFKSSSNIVGFETVSVSNINASLLAPGGVPGRLILMTKGAVESLSKTGLYTQNKIKDETYLSLKKKEDKNVLKADVEKVSKSKTKKVSDLNSKKKSLNSKVSVVEK